jgi:Arc/MetJ-type ribon-helix-helix transcriptional regulator
VLSYSTYDPSSEVTRTVAARVTISLPEELLAQLDAVAESESVTRSDVVREAAGAYLTARARGTEAEARKSAVEDGIAWLRGAAVRSTAEDTPSLDLLREVRGGSLGGGEQ